MSNIFKYVRIVFAVFSVIIMAVIFRFSCENSNTSTETSGHFTMFILENFVSGYSEMTPAKQESARLIVDHIVRKGAHFTIYASLGFCVSVTAGKRRYFTKGSLITVGICLLYACSDELHQYFVPGRSCMFTDVLLDTSGGITGMTIAWLIMTAISRSKTS